MFYKTGMKIISTSNNLIIFKVVSKLSFISLQSGRHFSKKENKLILQLEAKKLCLIKSEWYLWHVDFNKLHITTTYALDVTLTVHVFFKNDMSQFII